jgi:homoserine kinase
VTDRVRVRVPATSANLGPGFDALGLALAIHDEVEVSLTGEGLVVEPYADVPLDERNLVVRSLRAAFAATGGQPDGLSVAYRGRIPHSRGLGSSSAAICAGVVAGLALRGRSLDDDRDLALRLVADLEGHPDNVAPCLLGGLTVAWYTDQGGRDGRADRVARAVRLEPAAGLVPVVMVPQVRTSTEAARSALPERITHGDAAYNAGRAALLVAALTERPDVLLDATDDRLHQAFRLPAVPLSADLVARLRAAGVPAVLSGSGPSVLALCRGEQEADATAALAADVARTSAAGMELQVIRPLIDRDGTRVVDQ